MLHSESYQYQKHLTDWWPGRLVTQSGHLAYDFYVITQFYFIINTILYF